MEVESKWNNWQNMPNVWEWEGDNCAHILALLFHTMGLGLCAKTSNRYGTRISCGYNAMETLHFCG